MIAEARKLWRAEKSGVNHYRVAFGLMDRASPTASQIPASSG
jgi:hypothetical protein